LSRISREKHVDKPTR